jgi:hypothetical protein
MGVKDPLSCSQLLVIEPFLSQMNLVHILKSYLILSSCLRPCHQNSLFPLGFLTKILYAFDISHTRPTRLAHPALLDLTTLTIHRIIGFWTFSIVWYSRENLHLRTETDPVSETSCSLEYQTMEKVQKRQ